MIAAQDAELQKMLAGINDTALQNAIHQRQVEFGGQSFIFDPRNATLDGGNMLTPINLTINVTDSSGGLINSTQQTLEAVNGDLELEVAPSIT